MESIIQNKKQCYICGKTYGIEEHHIFFGGANRKLSEEDGLKIWLCQEHHRGTFGVHGKCGKVLNLELKRMAEQEWLIKNGKDLKDTESFIKRYGKNYL